MLALLVVAAAILTVPAVHLARSFAWRRTVVSRRVGITLRSGKMVSGHLVSERGDLLVVKNAHLHEPDVPAVPLDGDVVVEKSNVDFLQVLPPTEA